MADDEVARMSETAEVGRVFTVNADPSKKFSWLDTHLSSDTTPSGWREPVIVSSPASSAVPSTDVAMPVTMQGCGDE